MRQRRRGRQSAAGAERSADALGLHFERPDPERDVIVESKVMETLMEAERRHTGVGLAMLKLFFPGDLRPHEQAFWDEMRRVKAEKEAREKAAKDAAQPLSPQATFDDVPTLDSEGKPSGETFRSMYSEKPTIKDGTTSYVVSSR
ncbi:hypothetical protein NUW54_g6806 [Trametes sanguinea]|uniref:Uncharacterized protein n=1 Tax=Trametes sanguinea TaxID=158606 RepID=A0ACC1PT13_9APHY|nr:hypothetical protein NUW54_g6806 [Trametes sanguinea]